MLTGYSRVMGIRFCANQNEINFPYLDARNLIFYIF